MFSAGDGSTTFNIPDMREAVPVGIGTRPAGVANHDVYTLGQFKDDQFQRVRMTVAIVQGNNQGTLFEYDINYPVATQQRWNMQLEPYPRGNNSFVTDPAYVDPNYQWNNLSMSDNNTWVQNGGRHGKVTRGKRIGVNYIIKY